MIKLFENEIKVSQGYNVGSHTGNSRYAYDNCGRDTGISVRLYASTRLRVAHVDYKGGNGIYLHTLDKVQTNDINKYYGHLTIIIYHDNVVGHKVGGIINVGDIFYSEGTKGYATGNHIHLQIAKGHTTRYTCDILPHEVFYVNPKKTRVYSLGSVPFTISEVNPTAHLEVPTLSLSGDINYHTHIQNIGWQSSRRDSQLSGTTGRGLQIETIRIALNKKYQGSVYYQVHIQNRGWLTTVSNGNLAGTTGLGLQIEAIKVKLNSTLSRTHDIYYMVHMKDKGWSGWKKNWQIAGTVGESRRIEAVRVKLIKK